MEVRSPSSRPGKKGPASTSSFLWTFLHDRSTASSACVLVIDDEEDVREALRDVVEMEGCSVILAASAKEGMAILERQKPCLIILDLMMPGDERRGDAHSSCATTRPSVDPASADVDVRSVARARWRGPPAQAHRSRRAVPLDPQQLPLRRGVSAEAGAIAWLLDGDPAIRWQALRDLTGASAAEVAAERARVASEGVGARVLSLQATDGNWGGGTWNHGWNSTMHALTLLRELGLDPASDEARRATSLVRERVTWGACGPPECADHGFFAGETEPCINGQVAAAGAYFGQDVAPLVARLLGEQLADGGWNCDAERGSTRSSFNTTICVLEALLEQERASGSGHAGCARRGCGGRSTCSSDTCFAGGARARRSLPIARAGASGPSSPSPRGGTTTCSAGSTTCTAPASPATCGWTKRGHSWRRRATRRTRPTGRRAGRWTSSIPALRWSTWTTASAGQAGGTPCARCASCANR